MNKITVMINGSEYSLKGEEKEEYLHKVAMYVDKKIADILEMNSKLSISDAAVLTAVNVVDEMYKCDNEIETLSKKLEESQKEQKRLLSQVEDLKRHIKNLTEFNEELQNKLENSQDGEYLKQYEDENRRLDEEIELLKDKSKQYIKEKNDLKSENKELKFQVQSSKYKIMDLQNRLIENQIDLVKMKKQESPLLNVK